MTLQQIFAHAGEDHTTTAAAVTHYAAPWYIALPVFLGVVAVIGYFAWLICRRNMRKVIYVLTIVFLVTGFTLINVSMLVCVISITFAVICGGFVLFTALLDNKSEK